MFLNAFLLTPISLLFSLGNVNLGIIEAGASTGILRLHKDIHHK